MDKTKSKDGLRAAGKKRLEEFRQKKQQKGSSNKSSSTAIKVLADDKSPSGTSAAPVSPVTQQGNDLHQKSDGHSANLAGTLEVGVEPPRQVQSSVDESPEPGDSKLEMPLSRRNSIEPESRGGSEAFIPAEFQSNSELVTSSGSLDQNHGREYGSRGRETIDSSAPSVGSGHYIQSEHLSNEISSDNRLDTSSSNISDIQTLHKDGDEAPTSRNKTPVVSEEAVMQNFITEIETLKRQLETLGEEKEFVSNELVVKAEQQLEDASKVKSLVAEVESIQQELSSIKNEKAQLVLEFSSSQKELQDTNRHLSSELVACQEQVAAAKHRASLLSEDLERSQQDVVDATNKFSVEIESMQKLVESGEVRISELMEELATSKVLFHGSQDEKASLSDELGRFENELHARDHELLKKGIELEASMQSVQALEEDLASAQKTLQEVQGLVAEKSQLVEAGRVSNEKFEALLLAKELEFGAHGDQIRHMESERSGLVHQLEEFKQHLDNARQKEEGVRADFEAQYEANQKHLKQLQDEKVELSDELERSKLLAKNLSDERSILVAAFDVDLDQLREEVRQREEEDMKQGKQLLESRRELQKLSDEHGKVLKEMEISLDECRTALDRESDEKSKAVHELMSVRDQLLRLIEEKGQEVVELGNQLQEHKDQLNTKVGENSSLVTLLEESNGKLQETANCLSELEAEVEKHRAVSDGLLAEKRSLAVELLEVQEQGELMQQSAQKHELELERVRENLRLLREDHSKLSSQLLAATDELTKVTTDMATVELELVSYREQVMTLEGQNSNLVKLLEDAQNDLQRVREDSLLSASDLASELDKLRVLFSDLLVEKERLASELQLAIEKSQYLEQEIAQSGKDYNTELEEHRNHLKELEDSHSILSNALTVSQSEMPKLKEENSLAKLELARSKEQVIKLEDVNKVLSGEFDQHREQSNAVLHEKERLVADYVAELDKFRQQQKDGEEAKTKQTAHLQQLFSDLQDSRNEKVLMGSELQTYKEQYQELGDENWKVASEFNKCKDQLQLLTEEKASAESMLEESKELERKLKESNVVLMEELEDQRKCQQNILEQKVNEIEKLQHQVEELVQSEGDMSRELAATRGHSQVLEVARLEILSKAGGLSRKLNSIFTENDVLQSELNVTRQQLQELEEQNGHLILKLEGALENWEVEKSQLSRDLEVSSQREELLSAEKAQVDSEVAELRLKARELDVQRVQLAMEVGALKEFIESSEQQRAHRVGDVEGKDQLLQTLAEEKSQLDFHLQKERAKVTGHDYQIRQLTENLGTAKLTIEELESETGQLRADLKSSLTRVELLMEEKSNLAEDLFLKEEQLRKAVEETLHLKVFEEQLQSKRDQLEDSLVRGGELDIKVSELTKAAANLQAEKEIAMETLLARQEELRQSKNNFIDETALLEGRLRGVEGIATTLRMERDDLAGKLAGVEQSHNHLSARAFQDFQEKLSLQDQVAKYEIQVAEYSTELGNHKDLVSQSNLLLQSLVQELEDAVFDVFPKVGEEFLSTQYNKLSIDHHNSLVSRLHMETKRVSHELQNAHLQVSEMSKQLQQAEGQLMLLQKEATIAVETAEQIQSQLEKAADEKVELETSLQRVEAVVSAQNVRVNEQAVTFTHLQTERDDLAGRLASLEQRHTIMAEKALQDSQDKLSLQDKLTALEVKVDEYNTELESQKDMLSHLNLLLQSLVQRLEDVICDAFPKASQELLSSQYRKDNPDYHNSLASRLLMETTGVCHQLQNAHLQVSEMNKQLQEAEDQSKLLLEEKTMAVATAEQIQSQLLKAAREKEELEISVKRLESLVSVENVRVDERAITFASQASEAEGLLLQRESLKKQLEDVQVEKEYLHTSLAQAEETLLVTREKLGNQASEAEGLVLQIQSLNKELEDAHVEKEYLQAQAEEKLLVTREKLSLAVSKGKAVVQQRDLWKKSLAEKSKELEILVVGHQQDVHDRDAALNKAERTILDLRESLEQMTSLEVQLDSLKKMFLTAEQVFLENEDLVHSLCAVLHNASLPGGWRSIELAEKILWIIGCANKLLQELEATKDEIQTLMKDATKLTSSIRDSEARATAVALQVRSLEHEKEELASRLEDGNSQLQQERVQMTEEKAQLTGVIRQLDSDVKLLKREKEDLATRLQERAQGLEAEIAALVTRVTEQEWDLNTRILSYRRLGAAVNTLFSSLGDCYETISPIEIDTISAYASWDQCKYIINLLIDNHNLTVVKLKDILGEASLLNSASEEAVLDGLPQRFDDKISSKEISNSVIGIIEQALTSLEQKAISLAGEHEEKNRLQLELTQRDESLNAVREKLSAAVSEGKSLGEQRDSFKQALMDKIAELDTLETAHEEELRSKDLLLQDASNMLESSLEHVVGLEKELVSFKNSVASNPDPSLGDRLSEMDRQISETQQRARAAESEAEDNRNAAAVLSSQLELSQMRLDSLVEEVNSFTKDNNELLQQLESSGNKYRVELQELIAERSQLISAISNLEQDLAEQKEERVKLVENYKEVSDKCSESRLQAEEFASSKEVLLREIEASQQRIADLKTALDHEAGARVKLESATEAVVARIQNITGGPVMERSLDSMTSSPGNAQSSSKLDLLSALLIQKFEVALQEIQELAKQKALLAESQQTIMVKALSEREMLEQLQESIVSRDLELIEMRKRIEDAEASKGFLEELREELARASSERDALRNELAQTEQKGAITREKLGLAIKKGKAVAQQRDLLKQSFSEQESLVTKYKNELEKKESALQKATQKLSTCEEKVHALELSVSSCRSSASILEHQLQEKDKLAKKMEAILLKWKFSREFQSRDVTEKLEYLIGAVSNAQNRLIVAGQETDALKKASAQLSSDLTDAHTRAALEQESRSMLGVKLEKSLFELEQSRNRIAELETLSREVGGVGQQTEMLSREVLNLKESLQQKQAEVSRAEEAVIAWANRSEESEKYIQLCQGKISELEQTLQGSAGAQERIDLLHEKVARLEEAVQEKDAAVKAMESSRGKAINKLTLTTNKFRELYQQSAGLVEELERMHKNLQDKDAEITQLKEEAVKIGSQSRISQEMLESKSAFQLHLEKLLETAVLYGSDSAASSSMTQQEDQFAGKSVEDRCIAHVHLLRNQLSALTAQQADVEKKDVQLQGLREELEEVGSERANLKANLQREQIQSERLKAEIVSMHAPLTERGANQPGEIEEVQAGKRLVPINTPTPHVRGARRPSPIDVAIDVDSQTNQLVVEFDDKGHGFKSLTSSRFMPRRARVIGELIDRLCVGGGRVLMRQPAARLLVTLYWLAIHIWMVFLISAAHI